MARGELEISRRDFLRGLGIVTGSVMLGGYRMPEDVGAEAGEIIDNGDELFEEVYVDGGLTAAEAGETVLNRKLVRVRSEQLGGEKVKMRMFDGVAHEFGKGRKGEVYGNGYSWSGKGEGENDEANFVVMDSANGLVVSGLVTVGGRAYSVRYSGSGDVHYLDELDNNYQMRDIHLEEVGEAKYWKIDEEGVAKMEIEGGSSPIVVDYALFYTSKCIAYAGGEAALMAQLNLAVALANQAIKNSLPPDFDLTLRVVEMKEVPFEEDSNDLLGNAGNFSDSIDVQRWTVESRADIPVLFVSRASTACGAALPLMPWYREEYPGYKPNVIVATECISVHTFAHEAGLGHMAGAGHHKTDDVFWEGYFWDSSAHHDSQETTIMSNCTNPPPGGCGPGVNRFSKGVPPDASHENNARTIRENVAYVASWSDVRMWRTFFSFLPVVVRE